MSQNKKLTKFLLIGATLFLLLASKLQTPSSVFASTIEGYGLEPIKIPYFLDISTIRNWTPISYIATLLSVGFVLLVALWVFRIVRATVIIINSRGEGKDIEAASKKVLNIFAGIALLFLFFVGLSLLGGFLGVGDLFNWPRAFSRCNNGDFHFQVALKAGGELSNDAVDSICFSRDGNTVRDDDALQSCLNACSGDAATVSACRVRCNNTANPSNAPSCSQTCQETVNNGTFGGSLDDCMALCGT